METRLDEQLQAVAEQRAELDAKETEAIAAVHGEDQENTLLIGTFLEAKARRAFELIDKRPRQPTTELDGTFDDSEDDENRSMLDCAEAEKEAGKVVQPEEVGQREEMGKVVRPENGEQI